MKRLFVFLAILNCINFISLAQSPQKFKYQAVVRNHKGTAITNQLVSLRIAIVKDNPSGFEVYSKTFN